MMPAAQTLVVGATGFLGTEIVRLLAGSGTPVRAMVRTGADANKRAVLETLSPELCTADLKDSSSLDRACNGVGVVVSTASAVLSRQAGDSIEAVDEQGQINLVEAAERQGVRHFVFVSFPPSPVDFALQRAKRRVEERLRQGSMSFAVLQPAFFADVWLSPALGFDHVHGRARVLGDGNSAVSWISLHDVARFAVAACENGRFAGRVVPIGGPDPLTQLQVLRIFEEMGGPPFAVDYVPESTLRAQLSAASNPIEETFAALMLTLCQGAVVDPRSALELLPGRLTTVRDYAGRLLRK
jgi:uncharacterized protein YbjT (DUF2867 family)